MDWNGWIYSDDHYIYYCGKESLRRNGVAIIVNKRVWNAVLGCSLKNDRTISVHFQGKPLNIAVIQVYAPTSNVEESEVEWFYEDLWTSLVAQTVKHLPTMRETQVQSMGQEDLLEKEMATQPVFLPEKSHGQKSLVGYRPWGRKESDTTEQLHFTSSWRPTRPSRTNTQKRCPFHYRELECNSRKSRNNRSNRQIWPWRTKWSRQRLIEFFQENALVIANTLFQQQRRGLYI